MTRGLVFLACLLATGAAWAQAPTADCVHWKKMSNGQWFSTIQAKIGNPKDFKVLEPGVAVPRDMSIVGLNVSDTLDRLCGGAK